MELPVDYHATPPAIRRQVREEYARRQGGKCFWCGEPLSGDPAKHILTKKVIWALFPPNFRKHPVHLQHDHKTGMTEGAVHMRCNAVMWQFHGR